MRLLPARALNCLRRANLELRRRVQLGTDPDELVHRKAIELDIARDHMRKLEAENMSLRSAAEQNRQLLSIQHEEEQARLQRSRACVLS